MANERPQRLEQALRERVVGDCDRLEHIWTTDIPPNVGATLFVEARCQDGGDNDQGFCFSYATKPDGPYEPLFILSADAPQPRVGRGLPQGITGALYVKVEDTDRTPGQTQPDTLHVDALYVLYEIDKSPFGMGDAVGGFPRAIATDLALYGSSHVGYLGGVVKTTDVNGILQLDLLKTDWHAGRAYPSYLYFNPHADPKRVTLDVGPGLRDLYETVTERFVARGVRGPTAVTVPPDAAIVVVLCPAGGNLTHQGHRTLVDGVVVDWSYPTVMIESPKPGEPVRGNTPLRFRVCTPARLPLRQCAVRVDGRLAYSGSAIPPELKLDTAQWQDGFHLVRISAETEGPAFDAVAAEVFFDNGRAAMLFDARTMAAWSKLPGSSAEAAVHEGCAVITSPKQTWAAVLSAPFSLDF
ncbi:MAG: hypothetical protein FJ278_22665, partial [Planctomycetes bacterium]|nr:hypothetical protein [Planctomycetota bacterium]